MLDLETYLHRIGWTGPLAPDHATLTGLLQAHMRSIPFENLDVLLGRPISLELGDIQRKLIGSQRGGYCFEHASLFEAVLQAIGFRTSCHLARVVLAARKHLSSRTHLFVLVDLPEGRFVADPGFGGPTAPGPVPLSDGGVTAPDTASHWFSRDGSTWALHGRDGTDTLNLWVTDLTTDYPIDVETSNHFVSTHPSSVFTTAIMMNRFTTNGRISVMNRAVTLWRKGECQTWELEDRGALRRLLAEHFGIDLPESETLRVPAIPAWA